MLGCELFSNEIIGILQRDVNMPAKILYEAHLSLETFMQTCIPEDRQADG